MQASPISAVGPLPSKSSGPSPAIIMPEITPQPISGLQAMASAAAGISFSSNSSSSSEDESDDEDTDEGAGESQEGRKRKHGEEGLSGSDKSKKLMAFFDGLMKQLMEKQEAMQQRFLVTIEKREQDRVMREEAWRWQEMARLNHEQELLAQERAMAVSRDAALILYLQKIGSDQSLPLSALPVVSAATIVPPLPEKASETLKPQQQPKSLPPAAIQPLQQQPPTEAPALAPQPQWEQQQLSTIAEATELITVSEQQKGAGSLSFEPMSSSRWPKEEINALINLRSNLESRYQEAGAKGPLWEEISAGMLKLGYNRNAKRCKEKWENINKYFKKVKESNKKRPESAKTCLYFDQLDALYRQKQLGVGGEIQQQQEQKTNTDPNATAQAPVQQQPMKTVGKNGNNGNENGGNSDSGDVKVQTSNGGLAPSFYRMKKPEDIIKEMMQQQSCIMDEEDSNNMDENYSDDDDDEEDDEDGKMQYKIQYQWPNMSGNGGGNTSKAAAPTATAGSFFAIVQ